VSNLEAVTAMPGHMMDDPMMASSPKAGSLMQGEFDLMFIDMMIVHHQGAIAMANVALERAEHQEIRDLATSILSTQQGEIDQMQLWRDSWYPGAATMPMEQMSEIMTIFGFGPGMVGTPGSEMGDMMGTPPAGMSGDMMGMSDPQADMASLCNATGPFDQTFLQMMIPHHQGAVVMAQAAIANAIHPEIKELANSIIIAQQAEIAQMEEWLTGWYGVPELPAATGSPDAD